MAYTDCLDRILVISFLNQLDKHNKDYTPLGNFFCNSNKFIIFLIYFYFHLFIFKVNCVVNFKGNLEARVEKEKNLSLKSIFLINNYNFIYKVNYFQN